MVYQFLHSKIIDKISSINKNNPSLLIGYGLIAPLQACIPCYLWYSVCPPILVLDFRGRIYRSGVLHFHERDLARSLLVFSGKKNHSEYESRRVLVSAAAFHYKAFVSLGDTYQWYLENPSVLHHSEDSLIQFAQKVFSLAFALLVRHSFFFSYST